LEEAGEVDMDKLTVSGFSIGGATALAAPSFDPRIKLSVLLDPWLLPFKEEVEKDELCISVPTVFMFTDSFHFFIEKTFKF
jgi:cephalosporin-C deacetylase-like acetyl esterase